MQIIIKGESFEFDPNKLTFNEAKSIEKATGLKFGKFGEDLAEGSTSAIQAYAWVLLRRNNPELRFDDLGDFELGSLEVIPDADDPDPASLPVQSKPVDPTQKASRKPASTS